MYWFFFKYIYIYIYSIWSEKKKKITKSNPGNRNVCIKDNYIRFTYTVADIGSLESLQIFLNKYLYRILVQFEQNRSAQNTRYFELFNKKKKKEKKIVNHCKALGPFWKKFFVLCYFILVCFLLEFFLFLFLFCFLGGFRFRRPWGYRLIFILQYIYICT